MEQAEQHADKGQIKELEAWLAKVESERKGKGQGKYTRHIESHIH